MVVSVTDNVWDRHGKAWEHFRPPLRPHHSDIATYESLVARRLAGVRLPRVLLLGVTPEILLMRWPEDTRIACVEKSPGMGEVYARHIAFVDDSVHVRLVRGSWLLMASNPEVTRGGPVDLVIGDGCYTQLAARQYAELGNAVKSVLKPEGVFIHRFFLKEHNEVPEAVMALREESFGAGSFSAFKLRLLMACQKTVDDGVRLGDVYKTWCDWLEKRRFLDVKPQHWSAAEVMTLQHYECSSARYTFPAARDEERREFLGHYLGPLHCAGTHSSFEYELSDHCYTLELVP